MPTTSTAPSAPMELVVGSPRADNYFPSDFEPQDTSSYPLEPTYHTNTLGLFSDSSDRPLHFGAAPALSDFFLASGTAAAPLQIDTYEIVGGWSKNAYGNDYTYIPHGKIEEVLSDDNGCEGMPLDVTTAATFQEPLPECATPPPRPTVKKLELVDSPTIRHCIEPAVLSPLSPIFPQFPNTPTEEADDDVIALEDVLADMKVVRSNLASLSHIIDVKHHTEICLHVQNSLKALTDQLRRCKREDGCNTRLLQKWESRLNSLRRTVSRLHNLIRLPLRQDRLDLLLSKLREHDLKICDLSKKLQHSLAKRRLDSRHVHVLSETHQALTDERENLDIRPRRQTKKRL